MDEVVKRTKVIIALVGPYAALGTEVVEACVRNGTHYVDITGEAWWIKRMVADHHEAAVAARVKVVHCCGYDSIPSDLGAQAVAEYIRSTLDRETASVTMLVDEFKGAASGGTIASVFGLFNEPPDVQRSIVDPYCLDPPHSTKGPDGADYYGVGYVKELRSWNYPFIMAGINTRVVRRSSALLGSSFSYHEAQAASRPGWLMAPLTVAIGALVLAFVGLSKPLHPLIRRLLPKQGEGPSPELQRTGYFKHRFVGVSAEGDGGSPAVVIAEMTGDRDPGYGWTSRAAVEAGICLAKQESELRKAGLPDGGVLTPASAMGHVLLDRLQQNAGTTWIIESMT